MSTTVLITGSKAGIGRGLLHAYAARPNTIVIAAIRDGPDNDTARALQNAAIGTGSKIIVAEYDAGSDKAGRNLVADLQQKHGIKHLDIVVANAGILKHCGPSASVSLDDMLEHFRINTLAPLVLYQATQHLLNASSATPKFFIMSSTLGSNGLMDNYPLQMVAYGVSKAASNFIAGRIHREESKIVVILVQPGWVQTAMGEKAAEYAGLSKSDVPVTIDESVQGMMKLFDNATKEEHSGKFYDQNMQIVPW